MVPYLRAANVKDGSLDLADVKSMDFDPSEQTTFGLRPGDVLVSEGAGSLAAVGASAVFSGEIEGVVCFQNTLLRLRPRTGTDSRYLMWWARHAYGSGLFASIAEGANIYHLGAENVRVLPITVPDSRSQRAIADYLDGETTRINRLIESLRLANDLLRERLAAAIESIVWSGHDPVVPLMRLTQDDRQIQYGIVLPGPDVDDGVPIVKGGNLLTGVLNATGLAKTTREIEAGYERSRLRADDIAFAIRGAVGACALVPKEVEGSNITQDVALIAPQEDVDPLWLLYVLRSPSVQGQAEARVLGATISGINIRDLKRLRVPLLGRARQREQAREIQRLQLERDSLAAARARQVDLLFERRQALITAAVTGRVEVPGVAA